MLKKILTSLCLIGGLASPAQADVIYLIFPNGQQGDRCHDMRTDADDAPAPVAGVGCPSTSVILPWSPVHPDDHIYDYVLQGSAAVYSPQAVLAPSITYPDIEGFISKVTGDSTIAGLSNAAEVRQGLAGLLPQLQFFAGNAAALQQCWADAKSVNGSTWLTSQVQAIVEGYASTYNVPLVAH